MSSVAVFTCSLGIVCKWSISVQESYPMQSVHSSFWPLVPLKFVGKSGMDWKDLGMIEHWWKLCANWCSRIVPHFAHESVIKSPKAMLTLAPGKNPWEPSANVAYLVKVILVTWSSMCDYLFSSFLVRGRGGGGGESLQAKEEVLYIKWAEANFFKECRGIVLRHFRDQP